MSNYSISFPNLGIHLDYVPKSFDVFGVTIALYGVIIGIGMLLGVCYANNEAKRTGQNPEDYWDLFIYLIIFSIIGARIYYVIFSWDMYKDDLLSIFNIRNGGLAIYGGVIGGAITIYFYSRKKKIPFFQIVDTVIPGLLIGQILGRFGNFTNREAFGGYCDGLFAMRLPVAMVQPSQITEEIASHMIDGTNYIQVHPTFLYESMWNLGVLIFILLYKKNKKFQGELMALYFIGYGIGRAWIEGLRTDQLILPFVGLPVSQLLAVTLVIVGIILSVWNRKRKDVG